MSWETRRNGRQYYTQTRRVNGRVVRIYIGGGAKGNAAAIRDCCRRQLIENRRRMRESMRAHIANEIRRFETDLLLLDALVNLLARDALEAAGYHLHRGQWRWRRAAKAAMSEHGRRELSG